VIERETTIVIVKIGEATFFRTIERNRILINYGPELGKMGRLWGVRLRGSLGAVCTL